MKYYVYILTDSILQGDVNILLYLVILIKILLCKMCPWLTRKVILFDTLKKCHLIVHLQHYNWKNIELKMFVLMSPTAAQQVEPIGHRWEIPQTKTYLKKYPIQSLIIIKFTFPSTCGFIPNNCDTIYIIVMYFLRQLFHFSYTDKN